MKVEDEDVAVLEVTFPAPSWTDCEVAGKALAENGWCGHTDWFAAAMDYQYCVVRGIPLIEWEGWDESVVDPAAASNVPLPDQFTIDDQPELPEDPPIVDPPAPAGAAASDAPVTTAAPPDEVADAADPPDPSSAELPEPASTSPVPEQQAPASAPAANDAAASLDAPAPPAEPLATAEQRQELIEAVRPFVKADDEGIVRQIVSSLGLSSFEKLTLKQFNGMMAKSRERAAKQQSAA